MKRIYLSVLITLTLCFASQAAVLTVDFSLNNMVYTDHDTSETISKPDYLSLYASISFDIDSYSFLDNTTVISSTSVNFDGLGIDGLHIDSPSIEREQSNGRDLYSNFYETEDYTVALSETYDGSQSFGEYFGAEAYGYLSYKDGFVYSVSSRIVSQVFFDPKNGDGTSDYPLIGSSLLDFFEYHKINSIPFTIEDAYRIHDYETLKTLEGIYSTGEAYITNITYGNNAVVTPEPSTALLLGIGIIGLVGMGRRRVS